ncbi:hypothetical protein ACP0CE_03300, partial [Metamycoplasma hominis]
SFNDSLKNIPLPSKWLRSISFFAGHNPWDFARTSAIVYFKPKPTNNKAPVFLFQKNTNLLAGFLGCESPGKYYLDNFAWGWSIGKIIRKYSKFMSFYRIPLFSNLLETILFFNG